ncbi:MAG TPA: Ig-like domain-containing protein [Polyangia bacterium]|nr:Ig-like domain-containing protein [Polyangia bacterium]
MTLRRGLLALAVLLSFGCTNSGDKYPFLTPTGGAGSVGTQPNGTVAVAITTPADGALVGANTVLTIDATADVSGGSDFVDTSSVKAVVTAANGTTAVATGPLASSGGDAFAGTISLGALPAGSYTLTVSAASSGGGTGSASIGLTVQAGPTLSVTSPVEGKAYNGSVTVEIVVDHGASPPVATLAGTPLTMLTLAASTDTTDTYRATVAFDPATPPPSGVQIFPPLSGEQLLDVTETSGSGTAEVRRTFVIDTSPPTITNTSPVTGQVVGGVISVTATVSDDSGVLDSSVQAIIGDQSGNPLFTLQLQPQGSGVYSALFDTRNLTGCPPPPATGLCIVYPTVSFRATDSVGNQVSLGYDFSVDNVAPLADLDPPQMRAMRLGPAGYECSFLFDPLSVNQDVGDMPNDGCMVPQVFDLRARIEDDGNRANGLKVVPIAGIDPDSTSVFVLTDTSQPLVVDSDGDGYCDEINPLLAPTNGPLTQSDQVLKIRLAGVPPAGSGDFRPDTSIPSGAPCGPGTATAPPKLLCTAEQPTIAIGYTDGSLPAVWSVEPIGGLRCLGNQLDTLANNIPDGQWACIAVATADLSGNKSVSRPMRVYVKYDDAGGFCATPPADAPAPPPCTGTYDAATQSATTGTSCQTLKYTGTEYYCAPGAC